MSKQLREACIHCHERGYFFGVLGSARTTCHWCAGKGYALVDAEIKHHESSFPVRSLIKKLAKLAERPHRSCPSAQCSCGASEHNAKVKELYEHLLAHVV